MVAKDRNTILQPDGRAAMAYKDLLVIVDDNPHTRERISHAADLAERFDAHLAGLCVSLIGAPAAERRTARARELFEDEIGRRRIATEWRSAAGFPVDVAAVQARYADLIVLGQLDPDDAEAPVNSPRPEDIALSGGRPILVVPYVGSYHAIGQRVLVAWDASREATRAVNDAMPLLAAASAVTVLTVDPVSDRTGHGDIPGADITLHLARHGVSASVEKTVSGGIGIGDLLLSRASDLDADLLVMGAYGHSRVRELMLGGATRTVLKTMTLPVLMSH
jgi:nucleotide-binding universal stress UspA family protein